jgi:hypothetical protein
MREVSTRGVPGRPTKGVARVIGGVAVVVMFAAVVAGLVGGAGTASGRSLAQASTSPATPVAPTAPEVDPGPNSSTVVTTGADTMAAIYRVAYLTGGDTVLVGATDTASDYAGAGQTDTGLQVAIVDGASVSTAAVPLPAGATLSTAYIGGASVTALDNGDFAVLYWGSNASEGNLNDTLPDYYIQVFAPDGNTVGSLVTLVNNGSEGDAEGSIATDSTNDGFVVAASTDLETDVIVQRYDNAGATVGAAFSFTGEDAFATVLDSAGDIVVQDETTGGSPQYIFIPAGATSSSSTGVLGGVSNPNGISVTSNSSGGFVGFTISGVTSDLDVQTISTSGALGSSAAVASVGSGIADADYIWSVVTLAAGRYALTLNPYAGNSVSGYPALDQVITVDSSLASATVNDMTTSGGGAAPIGPWAVADGDGGIDTYIDIPGAGYSTSGYPLDASVTAATYLDAVPIVTAGATQTFTAGGSAVTLDSGLGVSDEMSSTISSASVEIGGGFLTGDQLSADTTGTNISASYDAANGELSLSGNDTIAHYQSVLDSVAYSFDSSDGDPTNGGADTSRTIDWSVHDGTASSSTATSTLTVQLQTQAALTLTSTNGTSGTALTLTTSGGSGTGAVTYTATTGTAGGCTVSGDLLSVTSAGICSVTATKAADATYLQASSAATTVTFASASQTSTTSTTTTTTTTSTTTTTTTTTKTSPPRKRHPRPKPKPRPKQRVTVRIGGLRSGGIYFGAVPPPRCVAHTNFGHVSCRITRHQVRTTAGATVTYTALARGSAGAKATARVTVHTAKLELGGLRASKGIYVVKLGNDYMLRVASRIKPLYVDAAVAPSPPAGTHDWFVRAGSAHGIPVWTLRVYLPAALSRFAAWNLGIRVGDQTQIITIRT